MLARCGEHTSRGDSGDAGDAGDDDGDDGDRDGELTTAFAAM
jgi:hypothetical protein